MRLRYGRIAAAIAIAFAIRGVALWVLVPGVTAPQPRPTAEPRPCRSGEVVSAASQLYDGDRELDLFGALSRWPLEPQVASRILEEADRQRAAIAGLRQAAHCEERTLVGPDVSYGAFRVAQLALIEAKLRGDADAIVDLAELGYDLADTGDVLQAHIGAAIATQAIGALDVIDVSRPDLARRVEVLARRKVDREGLLGRDAAHGRDQVGTIRWILWRGASVRAAGRLEGEWTSNQEKARAAAARLY